MTTLERAKPSSERMLPLAIGVFLLVWVVRRLVAAWPFTTDDAYISLRYARHWAAGEGLLWNLGAPPVEGYSNFLSVVIATLGIRVGLDPMVLLRSLGAVSLVACCVLLWLHARRWVSPLLACAAPLALVAQTGSVWWAVSGMETTLYMALGLLATWLLLEGWGDPAAAPRAGRRLAAAGLVAFLVATTRPEGIAVGAVLGLCVLLWIRGAQRRDPAAARAGLRGLLAFALPLGVLFAAFTAWRLGYYGRLFPNTVYCKVNTAITDYQLLRDYGAIAWPLALASLPVLRPRRFDPRLLPFLLTAALYALLVRHADSVIASNHRHVLFAYAMLSVVAAAGLGRALGWLGARLGRRRWAVEAAAVVALALLVVFASPRSAAELRRAALGNADWMRARAEVAAYLNEHLPPEEIYATPDAGLIPYLTPHPVLDTLCLNCVEVTLPPISFDHERYAAFILAVRPRYIVAVVDDDHEIRTGWAMKILRATRDFHELYSEVAFFETTTQDFHFAVWETRATQTAPWAGG